MIVGIKCHFDAAHYLPNYPGKCKEMHGHTWTVEVEVCGDVDDETGMVVDLTILKRDVNNIIDKLDHKLLNDGMRIPTCENVALYIHDQLIAKYVIQNVKVQEGDGGWARS